MRQSYHKACYQATWEEWTELAQWLSLHKETRLAHTITTALARQEKLLPRKDTEYLSQYLSWREMKAAANVWGICFRDGSIEKIEAYASNLEYAKRLGWYEKTRDELTADANQRKSHP